MVRPRSPEILACVAGLAVLAGGLAARGYLRPSAMTGRIVLTPKLFDFGDAEQGQTLNHTFTLTNGWSSAIEIVQAQSSCGCTTTDDVAGRILGPGQSLAIPVSLKTGMDDGPRSGEITLYYRPAGRDAPPLDFKVARVVAHVVPDYWVRPTLVDFGTVDHLGPVTRTIRLRPNRLADVTITGFGCNHAAFSARPIPAPPGETDRYAEITFSGRTLWQSGPVSTTLTLNTTSRNAGRTEILARANFVAPIEARPASIVIGPRETGRVEREVRITAAPPVRIAALHCPEPGIDLTCTGAPDGREHRVRLSIGGDGPDRAFNSEVRIDVESLTGSGATEARTVTIPIHRLARRRE